MDPHDQLVDAKARNEGGVLLFLTVFALVNTVITLDDAENQCQHLDVIYLHLFEMFVMVV